MPTLPLLAHPSRQLLLALALLGATACNQTAPPAATAAPEATPDGSGRPGPDLTALRDSNVVRILTAYGKEHPQTQVRVRTSMGDVRVRLYEDTPLHRANFLLLANKGFFDETVFYRVEKGFVVQGGNSDHRTIQLGSYHLPPEIRPEHFHRRGAVGMARYDDKQNPGQLSSSHDFYFILGDKHSPEGAQALIGPGRKLTPEQAKAYATEGGSPALDGKYTVFGEVIEGMDVIEKISKVQVDDHNWPLKDVTMKVEVE